MADPFSFNAGAVESHYGGAVGAQLLTMAEADPSIVVVAADLGVSPVTGAFVAKYPDRFVETGIAEANAVSVAAGLAAGGMKPYVLQMGAFGALKCAEQIRTDLAATRMPVRILSAWSGLAMGYFGTSHHALEDLAIARTIPGLTVVSCCDDFAAQSLLEQTAKIEGPVFIRLTEGVAHPVYSARPVFGLGRFHSVRQGRDATIIGTGLGTQLAMAAAELLANDDIDVAVLDAAYLKPVDEEAVLHAARTTRAIVTVEEHGIVGGLGSAVADVLATHGVGIDLQMHALPDHPLSVGLPHVLYEHYGLTPAAVAARVRVSLSASPPAPSHPNRPQR
ncbi:transketolase family protein [Mycolicibacterium moriokaense]|nr:transketolase C-terminal domain-containing protein [Mycolicibacterium moriokaense]MCV7041692.1 transketolase [Mycolicibacterium moriokaense]